MAKTKSTDAKRPIEAYEHKGKQRANNPPVGLVTPETDPEDIATPKTYAYDPHLDPQLQWAGKAEHTSFEVPTISLHVHERIDPRTIIEAVRKRSAEDAFQMSLFEQERKEPLRDAVDFYKHPHGWSNRLVAGDSLLVMNSLLEKEGLAGKVQMIYLDPPYGIEYGSNFQPFVNKRDVKNRKDEDLTAEPEQIRAFRDTWAYEIHSYLTYLRDRLLLARELLTESGSVFVQISDANRHHVRELMDEVFEPRNFVEEIAFRKKNMTLGGTLLEGVCDYIIWYARNRGTTKFRRLFLSTETQGDTHWNMFELPDGSRHQMTREQVDSHKHLPDSAEVFTLLSLYPAGSFDTGIYEFLFEDKKYRPPAGRSWKSPIEGMQRLVYANRIFPYSGGNTLRYILKFNDYPVSPIHNVWLDTAPASDKQYVVQTSTNVIQRCLLMTTDPGDLVFDPTCGSGTTAYVAEQWGRRWITCDTSRVALTLAKQRLATAVFDYYELAYPTEGVGSGFRYKTVPHVTLKSIANNPEIDGLHTRWQPRLQAIRDKLNVLLAQTWQDWQLPREPEEDWPEEAQKLLADWWDLSRKRQADIDAAIARHADQETLYDQPFVDRKTVRVTGPFTVEAVPAPAVKAIDDLLPTPSKTAVEYLEADSSISRSGETLRQGEWRDELLRAGIRGKAGQFIRFARLEALPACRWLHADGETRPNEDGAKRLRESGPAYGSQRVVVSFGPEHAPLEQRQVEHAWEEARSLVPKPRLLVFAAFQFDPEAAKDIDEMKPELAGMQFLKVQMNADLLTDDLKKKRVSNESFWLIGQPDVSLRQIQRGEHRGQWEVEVYGFDYYNTRTGGIESGGADKIAVWLLDTDYDGRSLYPRQVFFPMAGENEGWARLARNLKAEIDEDLIEAYRGTLSLPFELGKHSRVAIKVVDDRGVESLKVIEVK